MIALRKWVHTNYRKDGGFSWIICFCSFVTVGIAFGIDSSFGVIVGSLIHQFNATEASVAWIGSIHTSIQFFSASASSLLVGQIGMGLIVLIGAALTCFSCAIATLSTNVFHLVITHGCLSGIGSGMLFMAGTIACSFHFEENHGLASGVVFAGGGIGTMFVSFYVNLLTATYGWKYYFIFCASICPLTCLLTCIICVVPNENDANRNKSMEKRRLINDENDDPKSSLVGILISIKLYYCIITIGYLLVTVLF